ncbi:MAG TPA: hypothetical protein DHW82_03350 [Spirochaetia bacterium]|nr:MAG: hypothetical protein A2Y41_05390 [Spirochaetes bacterium GWB1_36_13]HCL56029.1 hypothetical protein [Spirochaetia bacterium]
MKKEKQSERLSRFKSQISIFIRNDSFQILFILMLLSFIYHLAILFSSPFAFGSDGYYYVYQIQSFTTKGKFSPPDSSLTLYFLSFFGFILSNPLTALKIGTAFLISLMPLPVYLSARKFYPRSLAFAASFLIVFNPLSHYFVFEYVKNLGGIVFFLFLLAHSLQNKESLMKPKNLILLFFLLSAAFLTHKLSALFGGILFAGLLLHCFGKKPIFWILSIPLSILLIYFAGKIFPNTLYFSDFIRLKDFFTSSFYFNTALIFQFVPSHFLIQSVLILILFSFLFYFFLRKSLSSSPPFYFFGLLLFILFLFHFPFVNQQKDELLYRIFLLSFIPAAFFLPILFFKLKKILLYPFLLLFFASHWISVSWSLNHPKHDYLLYSQIIPLIKLPDNSLLIAHQGFDYYYWVATGKKSFHFLPEKKHQNRPLYRLAYAVNPSLIQKQIGKIDLKLFPGFYILLKEEDWQRFLLSLPENEKKKYQNWKNPYQKRKEFMLDNQKFRNYIKSKN